jgi:ribosomal protein L3
MRLHLGLLRRVCAHMLLLLFRVLFWSQLLDSAKVGEYQPGQKLDIAGMFKAGDNVDVAGTTVGKGFQGEHTAAAAASSSSGGSGGGSSNSMTDAGECQPQQWGQRKQ